MTMSFKVGEAVRWTSSNTGKEGVIVAFVPAGRRPCDIGFPKLGHESLPRDCRSFVVRGNAKGARPTLYWPLVSLLHAAEGLTQDEIAWCHKNGYP